MEVKLKQIILASASPRRKELLEQIGLEFEIIPAKGEEVITKTAPEEVVMELSRQKAIEVADMLVHTGIKGIWNFAHTDLKLPENITVENVHLSDSLMKLSYKIGHNGEGLWNNY